MRELDWNESLHKRRRNGIMGNRTLSLLCALTVSVIVSAAVWAHSSTSRASGAEEEPIVIVDESVNFPLVFEKSLNLNVQPKTSNPERYGGECEPLLQVVDRTGVFRICRYGGCASVYWVRSHQLVQPERVLAPPNDVYERSPEESNIFAMLYPNFLGFRCRVTRTLSHSR